MMKKQVLRFFALVSLILLIPLLSHVNAMSESEKISLGDEVAVGCVLDPFNEFIGVSVGSQDGKFNIGAFQPSQWDLLYSWPSSPWSSFTTVRIDGADYRYGETGTNVQPPEDIDSLTNASSWQIGEILVTQTVQIVTGTTTGNPDTIKIQYDVKNTGSDSHEVGVRVMMDTEINYNDGAPFRIPDFAQAITTETELLPPNIPQYYQAFFDLDDLEHVAQGTLIGGGATPPDRFIMVRWPNISNTVWDYTVTLGSSITPDSAVALYWYPTQLLSQQSRSYVTYYGIGGVTGTADLSITGPVQLDVVDNQWSPNPFTVIAYLQNNTGSTITGNSLTLDLSGASGLILDAGETATHDLPEIPPEETRQTSWNVRAVYDGIWPYSVYDETGLTAERSIDVPFIGSICGDFDHDNDVDEDDYNAFLSYFGSTPGDPNWSVEADFDGDDLVALPDFAAWYQCYMAYISSLNNNH